MYIDRPEADTILVEDDRFENFFPALLAGPVFRAAGKGIKWLAKKAVGGAGAAVRGGARAAGSAFNALRSRAEPEVDPSELEGYPEEELAEEFDIYGGDGGFALRHPMIAEMDEATFDEFAANLASAVEDDLQTVRDEDPSEYDFEFDEYAPRIAHFKKLKKKLKKLKKLAKKGLSLVGKVAPFASVIPGIGTAVAAVGSMAGRFGSKKKRRGAVTEFASQYVPQQVMEQGEAFLGDEEEVEVYDGVTGEVRDTSYNEAVNRALHNRAALLDEARASIR